MRKAFIDRVVALHRQQNVRMRDDSMNVAGLPLRFDSLLTIGLHKRGKEEKVMIKNKPLGRALLLTLALGVLLTMSGYARQTEPSAEGLEIAKSKSEEAPRRPDRARAQGSRDFEGREQPPGRCPHR